MGDDTISAMFTAIAGNNANFRNLLGSTLRSTRRFLLNLIDTPAVILLYHRVADLESDPRLLAVSPENFVKHIGYLKRNYNMIDIEEFVYLKKFKKKFPEKSVVLTFDDGYSDNYTQVLPILESYDVPAIFFISTLWVDTRNEFWWDDIERIFLTHHDLPERVEIESDNGKLFFDTSSKIERSKTYEKIRRIMRRSKAEQQQRILTSLISWSGIGTEGRTSHQSLNSEEIKKLSVSKLAEIGAHTHTHTQLSLYSPKEQYYEIKRSKEILERIIGRPVKHFAFPFGLKNDFTSHTTRICKDLSFDVCYLNFHFQVHRWTNRFKVPRILVRNWDAATFQSHMEMFFKY